MSIAIVALVGAPNVGKSTLFNRLVGDRLAVVDEVPGTTRDRLMAECEWGGTRFDLVDTGGIDPTTGAPGAPSPLSVGSSEYVAQIRSQALMAIRDADAVLFLADGQSGPTAADEDIAELLRRQQRSEAGRRLPPVLLVVNKCETEERLQGIYAFYRLGLGDPCPISALHGTGVGELLDAVLKLLPPGEAEGQEESRVRIAILGKPNVGKSSLLNRILGEERAIVSPTPGTTRDTVDTQLEVGGIGVTLIDTAGIRRRGKIEQGVEYYSVLRSLRAIERADVALLVLDAVEGVTAQDAHIAGFILEAHKSTVVLVNKWDLLRKEPGAAEAYTAEVRRALNFMDYVPVLFISALTGQKVEEVLPLALRVQEERLVRIPTADFNRLLREATQKHAPPTRAGRKLKIYYGAQVRTDPPTFLLHVNEPDLVHFTYRRFLENEIRRTYGFLGTPLQLSFRRR